jgi:two-component system, OmpR family, phosphate regulon sensor histidine kinase PhoR
VIDNGVGIPREDIPFIFKRFYRVAKHHSHAISGTGLGLSIVRRAVEAHGGSISVDSVQGVETTFIIRLPDAPVVEGSSPHFLTRGETEEDYQLLLNPSE